MALLMGDKKCCCSGMILSEILLAGAVISLALGSVVIVVGSLQAMLTDARNSFEALNIARAELVSAHLGTFSDLASYEKTDGFFTIKFSVAYRNSFTTNITADVSWIQGQTVKHRVLNDQIVDWRNAAGESDCDWLDLSEGSLSLLNATILDAHEGNVITDVAAQGDYVFVSADSATSSLPDLYVINIQNINNPIIESELNTGPGIASIAVAGDYIFAANAGSFQMQIIDVSDPGDPLLSSQAKLPGAIISGSAGFGQSVHFYADKMYIGLTKNTGPEFHIVDVSNPRAPIARGSYEIGSTVNDIAAQGNIAALVSPSANSIFLLNTSNPSAINEISRTSFTGWQTQGAQSVEMLGQEIAVGRSLGGFFSPYPELMILNSRILSSTTASLKTNSSMIDMLGFNNFLYTTTSDSLSAFQILKIREENSSSGPNPQLVMSSSLPSRGVGIACNSRALFVATQNNQNFFHVFVIP